MNVESSKNNKALNYAITKTFNPEILRIVSYIALIIMFLVGSILTSKFSGIHPEETAIYKLYGFNYACNLLDHQPSRTVSAMILPFWEIPFLLYVVFNFFEN